ncbi:hypothetical protein METHP14_630018 [Pseudomonas sp. P14-2025]
MVFAISFNAIRMVAGTGKNDRRWWSMDNDPVLEFGLQRGARGGRPGYAAGSDAVSLLP